jgi:hypothetical protein
MINASTHTRKIWRSHFDGADSTVGKFHLSISLPPFKDYCADKDTETRTIFN